MGETGTGEVDVETATARSPVRPAMRKATGIIASLNTPFAEDGSVDFESLARLIEHLVEAGATGCLANAVAAEVEALSTGERKRILDRIIEAADGRLMVIVGVSDRTVEGSIALAREAASAGAGAINWRVPGGLGGPALHDAVRRIAATGPEVFVLQDLDFQGPGLPPESILDLARLEPKLMSVKVESALPGAKISRLLDGGEGLHVMGGWPTTSMLDSLERGAHAFMPSHMIPTLVRLARLQRAGQADLAALLFERLLPLFAFIGQHLDVSLRVGKMLRVAEGVFRTERVRHALPFDRRMEDQARRLVARSRAAAREIEALLG